MQKVDPGHTFSHLLRTTRSRLGLTQQELADRLGCSQNYIAQLETGKKKSPSGVMLAALAALERQSIHSDNTPVPATQLPQGSDGRSEVPVNASLAAALHADFESILRSADDNRDRLGWLRVQLDQLSAVARTWLTPEEVNEEARRLAKKMGEEAARQRAEFERTLADPSRLGAEMERLRQRALLEDDARRSRKTG